MRSLLTPPRRATLGLGLTCLAFTALCGCTSTREQESLDAWRSLDSSLALPGPREALAPISSQTPLSEYLVMALQRNPSLHASAAHWRAGLARIPQERALPDPTLGYGVFVERGETRIGPQRHRFSFTQRLPWPGKLAYASAAALEAAEGARARTESAKQRLIYEVTEAYGEAFYLRQELAITRESLALVQQWEGLAQGRLRTGVASANQDVLAAQIEIVRLEDRLESLRRARAPKTQRLRQLLDLPAGFPIPLPSALPTSELAREPEELHALVAEHSPVLSEHEREIAARERAVDLAGQSYFPDLSLGVDYIEVGPARTPGVTGSGDDTILARFGFSLPVWIGRNRAKVQEAESRLRAARFERRAADARLATEVSDALYAHQDAERKRALYVENLIPKGEEALRNVAGALESNRGDVLALLRAQRVLLDLHLAKARADVDRVTSLARLELLTGVELRQPKADQ